MQTSNSDIAKLLREIAAVYTLHEKNIFEIRAYENAADAVEHSTSEVKDLWEEGKLDNVPGLGEKLRGYLDELFKIGRVAHFETVKKNLPGVFFDLLDVPGVGPKTARELAKLGVKSLEDIKKKIKTGELVEKGFSAKIAEKIMGGLEELGGREGRMLLPYASAQAARIVEYLKKSPDVKAAHPLGSLRRMTATIGDLDFSAASERPEAVIDYFVKMPGISQVVEKGENSATVVLQSGLHADLLVGKPETYGALLQHFTGSKQHNIKLRTLAEKKGFSLSEYGVRKIKGRRVLARLAESAKRANRSNNNTVIPTKTEEELYGVLGMETPPPEIREDTGEIEAALEHKLPDLVELKDIKGDLHTHSRYPIKNPSHGPGANSIEEMVKKAKEYDYEFIGISDHPPGHGIVSKQGIIDWVKKRTKYIQKLKQSTKSIRVLNGLEVDILGDGSMSVPDEALSTIDYCIAGIHSGHRGGQDLITRRLLLALSNPHVDIISHPTNRLLNERDSSEADWDEIFKIAARNNKILEVNAYPNRLDLRDNLVRQALKYGVKLVINTDAHAVDQMDTMLFGVSVARRGWAEKKDIVNSWDWTDFAKWFNIT